MFPIHLDLGFRVFYFYEGFYFMAAIAIAAAVAAWRQNRAGLDSARFLNALPGILLGAILGARVFHFAFWDLHAFLAHPLDFFAFWEGGLSITGGLAGGLLASWWFLRGPDCWRTFAETIPAVLLGQAIGRVGCFLNGDAWGIPTRLPWGVAEPRFGTLVPSFRPEHGIASAAWEWAVAQGYSSPQSLRTVPLHPTQLYEVLGDLLLMAAAVVLVRALRRSGGPWTRVIWLHVGGYAWLRFALEFLHGDRDMVVWADMSAMQVALLATGLVAAGLFIWSFRPQRAVGRPRPAR